MAARMNARPDTTYNTNPPDPLHTANPVYASFLQVLLIIHRTRDMGREEIGTLDAYLKPFLCGEL
jgi:hypothetical protein